MKISDAEWEVMRVVWTSQEATSMEIIHVLSEKMNWKPPTIKTLIGRLVKKDMLIANKDQNKYVYQATVSEADTVRSATENLFAHICARKVGQTIADLIQEAELTEMDRSKIQQALNEKQVVEAISCNCIPGQCECHEH